MSCPPSYLALSLCFLIGVLVQPGRTETPTDTVHAPDNTTFIRTPPAPQTPRINGPRIYGARPGHPFLYYIPVTGDRPISYSAEGLPKGLQLDSRTGIITGSTTETGEHLITLKVSNHLGSDMIQWKLVIGQKIQLTPQMGWNSWNCFHLKVTQKQVEEVADTLIASGLINHGWSFINLDEGWEGTRDSNGVLQPKSEFPDIKALADSLHARGLKFGIYSSPGPRACGGSVGSYGHEDQDAESWAGWGVDYLKYDWCSYSAIASLERAKLFGRFLDKADAARLLDLESRLTVLEQLHWQPHWHHELEAFPQTPEIKGAIAEYVGQSLQQIDAARKLVGDQAQALIDKAKLAAPEQTRNLDVQIFQAPYIRMRASLDRQPRDIVYSLCQYGMGDSWTWAESIGANSWRTGSDLYKVKEMEKFAFGLPATIGQWTGPGHYNDPDMLWVGNASTNFTPGYLYTHFTQWCILAAPLMIGSDLKTADAFQIALFSNDEVLAVNQDPLALSASRIQQSPEGKTEVWAKPLENGDCAVAFYNRGDNEQTVSIAWNDLKRSGAQLVRDLWRQTNLGRYDTGFSVKVEPHNAELFLIKATPRQIP